MTWGVCIEFSAVEQFRRTWSYLAQENKIPYTYERMPENLADWDKMDYGWENWHCVTDLSSVPDPIVVLSPADASHLPGEISLYEYEHPENVTYFFGSDTRDLWEYHLEDRDYTTLYIPFGGYMYSFSAAAMVIYDRRLKEWQS